MPCFDLNKGKDPGDSLLFCEHWGIPRVHTSSLHIEWLVVRHLVRPQAGVHCVAGTLEVMNISYTSVTDAPMPVLAGTKVGCHEVPLFDMSRESIVHCSLCGD
jgi:hypothetical protein